MPTKLTAADLDHLAERYLKGEGLEGLCRGARTSTPTLKAAITSRGITLRDRAAAMLTRHSRMTGGERKRLAAAANAACRGRKRSVAERAQGAHTRARNLAQATSYFVGEDEARLQQALEVCGIEVVPQQAALRYNLDLGISPVAVEVHRAANRPGGDARKRRRIKDLLDAGWHVVYVWITRAHPLADRAVAEIVTYVQEAKRNPTAPREHRVIRGSGEWTTAGPHFD